MRFLETFRRALPWVNTEVLFLYMFCIELLFIFSFITCHLKILQCVEFNNFFSIAVCSVLLLFHNVCPEYSWIPPEIIKFTALYAHRKRKLIEKNKEFSSILKRTDSSAFRVRVCLFFSQWLFVRDPYTEVYLLFIRDQVFVYIYCNQFKKL